MPRAEAPPELLERMSAVGDEVRIETIGPTPVWEFFPSPFHQVTVDEIRASIAPTSRESGCGCFHLADFWLRLPDGSLRRPDVGIFCERPSGIGRNALTTVPLAVVEILSPGGEFKDLQIGPPHYLSQGVLDVVVVDPETDVFTWFSRTGSRTGRRGETLDLAMGCRVTP